MTREEKENALHCLKVMIGEEVCEECNLYGTTGTDHCEADCVRVAIEALESKIDIFDKIKAEIHASAIFKPDYEWYVSEKRIMQIIDSYRQEG